VSFVLLPTSILLIKYFPDLGRGYGRYEGTQFYNGVALDKNMLGVTCLVLGLATTWRFLQELNGARRTKPLIVHGTVLAMALWLFWMANSMTSLSCFVLASGLMAALTFLKVAKKRSVVHVLVATVLVVCFCVLFVGVGGFLLTAMGRNPTLTGRTEVWEQLRKMIVNPVVGTGFESFWLGKRLEILWSIWWWHPNEAHNGYFEVYLNLGMVGVVLLGIAIVAGYQSVIKLLERDPEAGRLRLGYFVVGIAYSFTEAGFRMLSPIWIAFLLAIMAVPKLPMAKARAEKARTAEVSVSDAPMEESVSAFSADKGSASWLFAPSPQAGITVNTRSRS
jgi:O-antigen ligase